jgi:tRNA threonylcarbamoyladenosine biosynthesis protein TsaB
MRILAIDTSTDGCSAALLVAGNIKERFKIAPKQHTSLILPMIDELLTEADLKLEHLDTIAFGAGPGSFTGIRLAASIAQGLSFVADIPIMGVSALRTLAQEIYVEFKIPEILIVQDARMQEVYYGKYRVDSSKIMQSVDPDQIIAPGKLVDMINENDVGAGAGFVAYEDIFFKNHKVRVLDKQYPRAKYVSQLAVAEYERGGKFIAADRLPVYLREKVT